MAIIIQLNFNLKIVLIADISYLVIIYVMMQYYILLIVNNQKLKLKCNLPFMEYVAGLFCCFFVCYPL